MNFIRLSLKKKTSVLAWFVTLIAVLSLAITFALSSGQALADDVNGETNLANHSVSLGDLTSSLSSYPFVTVSDLNIPSGGIIIPLLSVNPLFDNNTINITSDKPNQTVIGGLVLGSGSSVNKNTVTITGATIGSGGAGSVYGGLSTHVAVTENKVTWV